MLGQLIGLNIWFSLFYSSLQYTTNQHVLSIIDDAPPQIIDQYLQDLLLQYRIPGIAIAVTIGQRKWSKVRMVSI